MITARNIKSQKGFTLIELLVVIGILAVLLAITLIAINPARQFAQANNTKRRSDVNAILNAIDQYAADNHGTLPAGISSCTSAVTPCELKSGANSATQVDVCTLLVTKYLAALPTDPKNGTNGTTVGGPVDVTACTAAAGYDTGYTVYQAAGTDNRITVSAPGTELGEPTISVSR